MRTSILLDTPSLPGSIFNSRIKCKYTKFDILNYLKIINITAMQYRIKFKWQMQTRKYSLFISKKLLEDHIKYKKYKDEFLYWICSYNDLSK